MDSGTRGGVGEGRGGVVAVELERILGGLMVSDQRINPKELLFLSRRLQIKIYLYIKHL